MLKIKIRMARKGQQVLETMIRPLLSIMEGRNQRHDYEGMKVRWQSWLPNLRMEWYGFENMRDFLSTDVGQKKMKGSIPKVSMSF